MPAAAQQPDLGALLASIARAPPQSIAFVEYRASPLLEEELVINGRLEYAGAGRLSRVALHPYAERTDIDGDSVTVSRPGRPVRRFSMRRIPELAGLMGGFQALLAGDRQRLEREFELTIAAMPHGWQLALVPQSKRARELAGDIRVRGEGDQPLCIVTGNPARGTHSLLALGVAADGTQARQRRAEFCGESP